MRPWFNSWVGKVPWRRDRPHTRVFLGFSCGSAGEESACHAGNLGSIPRLRRSSVGGNVNHPSILAWRISWTEEPRGLQSMGVSESRTLLSTHVHTSSSKERDFPDGPVVNIPCFQQGTWVWSLVGEHALGCSKKKKKSSKKSQQSMCVWVKMTCPFSTKSEEEKVNRYWLIWIYSHRWDCLLKEDFMNKRRRYLQAPLIDIICGTVFLSSGYRCVHLCAQRHTDTISD